MVISRQMQLLLLFTLASKPFIKCEYTNEMHMVASQSQMHLQQITTDVDNKNSVNLMKALRLEPSNWDFGILPVGRMKTQTFTLINDNENRSVYLNDIIIDAPAFYSSTFEEEKILLPLANATFNVIFMPRDSGIVSSVLRIQTSLGDTLLQLQGKGHPCPYRLKPIVGIQIPLNATILPLIYMHNPHNQQLTILEIYSSSDQFQLELPYEDNEQHIWQIPPYATKPVIRVRFQNSTAGLHTAYVRIKMSINENNEQSNNSAINRHDNILVIPLEIDVVPDYGLYIENPIVDFGYVAVHKQSEPLRQFLNLKHSNDSNKNCTIQWINQTLPQGMQYDAKHQMLILKPTHLLNISDDTLHENHIVLKFTTQRVTVTEKVHTTTITNHKVKIFVKFHIMKGRLSHQPSISILTLVDFQNKGKFKFKLTNTFAQCIAIYNVSLNWAQEDNVKEKVLLILQPLLSPNIFNDEKNYPVMLPHNVSLEMSFSLVKQSIKQLQANQKYKLSMYTNVTHFEIPMQISSGRLHITTQSHHIWRPQNPSNTELNLGTKLQPSYVILENPHPMNVQIIKWNMQTVEVVRCSITFLGVIKERFSISHNFGDHGVKMDKNKKKILFSEIDLIRANYTLKNYLNENDIAVFRLELHPYEQYCNDLHDYSLQQTMKISTQFENITINIKFILSRGHLEVDQEKLHFENCFPGKICCSELNIRSTYPRSLHVRTINFTEPGLKFVDREPLSGSKILADSTTPIGHIYFEPAKLCGSRCYTPSHTIPEISFPEMMVNNNRQIQHEQMAWPPFDELELRRRTDLYRHFKWYFQNLDLILTTREAVQFQLQLIIELDWPQLVVDGHQTLGSIEVNKIKEFFITIKNPADSPILVDYVLADPALAKDIHLFLPLEVIASTPNCCLTDTDVFTLINNTINQRILIMPGSSITVAVQFHATKPGTYCTLLHIRNNLTLYEAVWLSAITEEVQFQFHNLKPGSHSPLLFEMNEQHMEIVCSLFNHDNTDHESSVINKALLKRVFIARNLGKLPIHIDGIFIGERACEDHGFRIANCTPFELKANSSRPIEIIFTPDFTVNRIMKPLILKANNFEAYRYVLIGQLNQRGLEKCQELISRPSWELQTRQCVLIMLAITFILVHIAASLDYKRIFFHYVRLSNETDYRNQVQPLFNLQKICDRTTNFESSNATVYDRSSASPAKKKKSLGHKKLGDNDIKDSNLRKRNTRKNLKLSLATVSVPEQHTKNFKRNLYFGNNLLSWNSNESSDLENRLHKEQLLGDDCSSNEKIRTPKKSCWMTENNESICNIVNTPKPPKIYQRKVVKSNDLKNKHQEQKNDNTLWMVQNDCKKDKDREKNKDAEGSSGKNVNVKDDKEINEVMGKIFESPSKQKKSSNINKRLLGKTPGRERHKNMSRNKEITPRCMSFSNLMSSCSSSACSSTSLSCVSENKQCFEYTSDFKDCQNSLKLFDVSHFGEAKTTTSVTTTNCDSFNERLHEQYCTSPSWSTFNDVLQSQTIKDTNNSLVNTANIAMENNIRQLWQNSEYNGAFLSHQNMNDFKMQKLGPIGSKKLPQKYGVEHHNYIFENETSITSAPHQVAYGDDWKPSDYICALNQEQQKHSTGMCSNNIPNKANCWPRQLHTNAWSTVNSHNVSDKRPTIESTLHNTNNGMLNSWGIPLIRPPPGLENKYITPSRYIEQDAQYSTMAATSNNNSYLTGCSNTATSTTTAVSAAGNHIEPTTAVTISGLSMNTSNMLLFDPFGLSAIWSNSNNYNQ